MQISKIQLAVALVTALSITAPALADDSTNTNKTVKSSTSKVQVDDTTTTKKVKKDKKAKCDKSAKKSAKTAPESGTEQKDAK